MNERNTTDKEALELNRKSLAVERKTLRVAAATLVLTGLAATTAIVQWWPRSEPFDADAEIEGFAAGLADRGLGAATELVNNRISTEGRMPHLLTMLGITQLEQGHFFAAQAALKEASESRHDAACYLGHALLHTEGVSDDVLALSATELRVPDRAGEIVCLTLAITVELMSTDNRAVAIDVARMAVVEYPDSFELNALLADVLLAEGDPNDREEAKRHANHARSLQPGLVIGEIGVANTQMRLAPASDLEAWTSAEELLLDIGDRIEGNTIQDFAFRSVMAYLLANRPMGSNLDQARSLLKSTIAESPVKLYEQGAIVELLAMDLGLLVDDPAAFQPDEVRRLSEQPISARFSPVFVASGYRSLALLSSHSGAVDAAIEYTRRADATLEARGDPARGDFRGPLMEDVAGPAIEKCQFAGATVDCTHFPRPDLATYLGFWHGETDGTLVLVPDGNGGLVGALGLGDGRVWAQLAPDGSLKGQWCQQRPGRLQWGEFEMTAILIVGEVYLNGQWRYGVAEEPNQPWVEWDHVPLSSKPDSELVRQAEQLAGSEFSCDLN